MRPDLTENALKILDARYLKKDAGGNVVESPEELFERVARHVAMAEECFHSHAYAEELASRFYEAMAYREFLPNSPTLMNAGRQLGQLSACFVLPVGDSLESIFEAVKHTALIHQSGGGTGFSFSHVRPKNDIVSTTSGIASGPISFMKVFNMATDIIKQGGTRRGANMAVLRVDHPDIEEFITVKRNPEELGSFNLSVGITREFMGALKDDGQFDLINPRTGRSVRKISARVLFDLIVDSAWDSGEPGVLFLDHINRDNPTPQLGEIESTNPCGEQPLLPWESCNLGSVNLMKMVRRGLHGMEMDWDRLERTVQLAVRFLDDVIVINRYPLPEIEGITKGNRKIGLGVMGFAHCLILLGIPYESEQSIHLAEKIMKFVRRIGRETSQELAKERGAFPNFPASLYDEREEPPMRNATITTIAPTGTLSLIAGCSSGIEPLYALNYTRIIPGDLTITEMDPVFVQAARQEGLWTPEIQRFVEEQGVLPRGKDIPPRVRALFATALDIPPSHHVRMQAAFQKYTDNAVSKTINFPSTVSRGEIRDALLLAYDLGCKGATMYRDGSRSGQVLTCGLGKVC